MDESFDPYLSWLGIRHPERPPNHYRLLGVQLFEEDPEVLAHAADRQMAHVRTFQAGRHSADSQRVLNELAAAKICLLNALKKAPYDAELRAAEQPVEPPTTPDAPPMAIFPGVVDTDAIERLAPSDAETVPDPTTETPPDEGRSLLVPAVIAGLGLLVLLLAGSIGMLASRNGTSNKPSDTAAAASPSVSTPDDRPVAAPNSKPKAKPKRKQNRRPNRKPKPKQKLPADQPTKTKPAPKSKPTPDPTPKPTPKPRPGNLPPADESLAAARAAMVGRDAAAAKKHLDLADRAAYPKDRKEVERLQTILGYLNGFWDALRQGATLLKSGEILPVGSGLVEIVSVSGDKLVVKIDDKEQQYTIQTLPPKLALAIAGRALPDELPSSLLAKAAFLIFDPAGDPQLANRLCGMANQQGLPTDELRAELKQRRRANRRK